MFFVVFKEGSDDEDEDDRLFIWWLVFGLLIGGLMRIYEKVKLRKGVLILVFIFGWLLDYL